MPECWLGIDPGVSGAVAILDGEEIRLLDVPTRKAARGSVYLAGEMADLLAPYQGRGRVALEAVALRPGESGRNGLKIGRGAGLWEGILAAYHLAYEMPIPQVWKKEFALIGGDKAASRARAQELFPALRAELAKRRPDFSEALLLAEWVRRRWQKEKP